MLNGVNISSELLLKCVTNGITKSLLMNSFKKLSIATILVAIGAGVSTHAAPRLTGAGASFPAKIYTRWLADLGNLWATGVRANGDRKFLVLP